MPLELRDIEYFSVVAEHGSIGRAAEALGLSQPALSKSLRRLEAAVSAKVVKRTPKGVELTTVGGALLAQARRLRLTLDDIAREAADLGAGRAGHLRIGTNARQGSQLVPAACATLVAEAPGVTLKVTIEETNRGAPALSSGELDLYIAANPLIGHDDVVQDPLYEEEWVVMTSARHRLAGKKQVTIADLAKERWLLGLYGPTQDELLRDLARSGLAAPTIAAEVNSMLFRREILPATDWLTFAPRQFFHEGPFCSRVVALPVKGLSRRRPVNVCYRKDAYLSPAAKRLIEILKATAKDIAKEL